ncbi:MAG TPA: hypothetical protein VMJ10_18120 [Kofleriaceae bacterium]|nr:hypothetical protein [Kofleriaceae bacterium]
MRQTIGVVLLLAAGVVYAGPNDDQADVLFQQGKTLEKDGKTLEACGKYQQALRLNANAIGIILNVALCDQNAQKYASAYKLFTDARNRAREQNLPEQLKAAEEHLAQVEENVAHLGLGFAEPPTEDTKIVVGDEVVPIGQVGDVLVDEGQVSIEVSRPGRVAYETKVSVAKGEHKAIAIPALALPVTVKSGRHTFGKIVTISGGALVVTGVVLGVIAWHDYNQQFDMGHCMKGLCDQTGQPAVESAQTLGNVGTAVGIGGLVVASVGAYLWFFGRHDDKLAFVPTVNPEQMGLAAVGHF